MKDEREDDGNDYKNDDELMRKTFVDLRKSRGLIKLMGRGL